MKDFGNGRISVGLNYGKVQTENEDVIFIETEYHSSDGYNSPEDSIIAVTAEDAVIIARELLKFAALFKTDSKKH